MATCNVLSVMKTIMDFNIHKETLFNLAVIIMISRYIISFYVFGSLNRVVVAQYFVTEHHIKIILLLYLFQLLLYSLLPRVPFKPGTIFLPDLFIATVLITISPLCLDDE